ncbi:hypothetical protein N7462_002454 [Penicillium macrosclerotiorum]|uniref:uncharacterized protein n=1 Tax=Penicillium macrosclerotiorum TaxID=303699 RepID=UPI002546E1C9|nr:uncharacterized protein N7462_002454 [Penicillium macrosclerotiorum]KAJ5693031.1 hypothetical protein N7462_002454 [Penicillium macrosclerotiorum]
MVNSCEPLFQHGAFFGVIIVYIVNERWGRRLVLLWGSFIFIIGVILSMACGGNIPMFYVARIVSGLGVGASTFAVPQYLSECAPPAARGGIVGCVRIKKLISAVRNWDPDRNNNWILD